MRIGIREQLGAVVIFCSLVPLAVLAVATWVCFFPRPPLRQTSLFKNPVHLAITLICRQQCLLLITLTSHWSSNLGLGKESSKLTVRSLPIDK
jgi:hypothetical protein